ncbi:MAG: hypothetical protein B7Z08_12520 [Sphingomonadales bacterium 32-68-7]|nr:MAG: hypothetical protein B7Z33_12895 [Sphingomonadales bacterium 12-68-11]OYX07341.1 MAG: hypothetical protein B7Z08_12520 [Sphingomonadales bacterium 32-68-7]
MDHHGALVGWTHVDLGHQALVRLESVRSADAAEQPEPDVFRVLMTKSQAAVLGSYLLSLSGQSAPRGGGWLKRWFG